MEAAQQFSAVEVAHHWTQIEAESMRRSLREFVKGAWHVVEPGSDYVSGWHIDAICDHLTYVSLGDIDDLVINIPPRHSKACPVDAPVLTTHGWKAHGDLMPGDFVYGKDGQPKRVLATTGKRIEPTYTLTFDDGSEVIASKAHLWEVLRDAGETPRKRRRMVVTTDELVSRSGIGGGRRDAIEISEAFVGSPQNLLIDPHLLGAWLGDGSSDAGCVYVSEQDMFYLKRHDPSYRRTVVADGNTMCAKDFYAATVPDLSVRLRVMGLKGCKRIPNEYLLATVEDRWELLRGLMDSDGHAQKDGTCTFSNKDRELAEQVLHLVRGLGLKCRMREYEAKIGNKSYGAAYRVNFVCRDGDQVFTIPRKQAVVVPGKSKKSRRRYLKSVEYHSDQLVSCIKVEGELYLLGKEMVVTHNSTIVAVMWPAWEWVWHPSVQWLFATYAQSLTIRDSVKCRRLIQSPWYQDHFGDCYQLSNDLNQKGRFDNNYNGYRLATSVGGTATGEGGDRIVVDDAHNMKEIMSDTVREGVIDWWRNVMSTRGNNPKALGRVIIAQRGHHKDLPGHVLSSGNWVHLNLPGYFRKKTACVTRAKKDSTRPRIQSTEDHHHIGDDYPRLKKDQVIFVDPRKKDDQLLTPDRFGPVEMAKIAEELTERGFESQIQQNPSAEQGNILKKTHWREWMDEALPPIQMVIQCYDTAFEEEEENDYSARTTWGVFEHEEYLNPALPWTAKYKGQTRLCLILLERMNERLTFPDLRDKAIVGNDLWKPDRILIEKKASGHSLAQDLRKANLPVARIKVTDSKFVRAHAASLVLERGCVWYVKRNWANEVIDQCAEFPAGDHDDMTDTVTMALMWLRKHWSADYLDEDDNDNLMRHTNKPVRTYGGTRGAD